MNKYLRLLLDREFRFSVLTARGFYKSMPDEEFLRRKYRIVFGKELELMHPRTFNEKLQWLKLHDRNPLYTTLVDKYAVRRYIADKLGEDYLVPLVGGPWDHVEDIDFDALPRQFVLKCTHDSGGVIVVKDKQQLNRAETIAKLRKRLKRNYYYGNREWPYKDVKPRIIAEKYLEDESGELRDFKYYCFKGKPRFMLITTDRASKDKPTCYTYFDMDFNMLPFYWSGPHSGSELTKPKNFEIMAKIAADLSQGLPHVRVDMYDVGGKIYFGEMTLYDGSGFAAFDPPEWDEIFGSWIELPGL